MAILRCVRSFSRVVAVSAAVWTAGVAVAGAAELGSFRVGNWAGSILSNENTGMFESCQGTARYENGSALSFAVKHTLTWSFGLGSDRWAFNTGQTYPVTYWIDTSKPTETEGVAASAQQISVGLSNDDETFLRFRRGAKLRVRVGEEMLSFDLTRTDKLITTLIDCAKENGRDLTAEVELGAGNEIDEIALGAIPAITEDETSTGAVTSEPPIIRDVARSMPTPLERVEATAELANLLAGADIRGFEIVPAHKAPDAFRRHDAIWRNDSITGSLRIITDNELGDLALVRASLIASDARTCTGQFAALAVSDQVNNELSTMSMSTACENGETDWSAHYSTHPRADGGYYLLTLVGAPEASEMIKTVGAQLQQVATMPRRRSTFQAFQPQ